MNPEKRCAADSLCQQRRSHVAAGIDRRDRVATDDDHRAEAEHEGQQIEEPDERRRIAHGRARRARVRNGIEPHQDVWQPGRAEHQRQAERHGIDRIGDLTPGAENAGAVHAPRLVRRARAD